MTRPRTADSLALPVALAVALALLLKAVLVACRADVFTYGEELAKGAAAKAILDGLPVPHHQLAYHYYEGGGFVASHLTALAYALVGQSLLAHKLVALAMNAAIAAAGALLAGRAFGRGAAFAFALLFAFAPEGFQKISLLNLGIHYEASLFLLLELLLAHAVLAEERASSARSLALGLCMGFGAFYSYQTLPAAGFLLLVLAATRKLGPTRLVPLAWGALIGLAPLLWMWTTVGTAVFDVHGTALFAGEAEAGRMAQLAEFLTSVARVPGRAATAALLFAGAAGGALVQRSAAPAARRGVLLVAGYLGLFGAVYLASPFVVGELKHHFLLERLTPFWLLASLLTAGLAGALARAGGARRAAGRLLVGALVALGAAGTVSAAREGYPSSLAANLRVVAGTKGYSYRVYFAKFRKHLDGSLARQLAAMLSFREDRPELLRTSVAQSFFDGSVPAEELLAAFQAVDPAHELDYVLGLGPHLLALHSDDALAALRYAERLPPRLRPHVVEAIGRGQAWRTYPEMLRKDLERVGAEATPDYLRGLGHRLYEAFRVFPEQAEAFAAELPVAQRAPMLEGFRRAQEQGTLACAR